jgi:hypothetical protein
MRREEEIEEQLGWLFAAAVERSEVAEYTLGMRPYWVDSGEVECFYRLHEVVIWLAACAAPERETRTLRLAAAIAATDRELAALVTAGVAAHTGEGWQPVPDAAYFAVAVRHGNVRDYLAMRRNYAVPASLQSIQPRVRQEHVYRLYTATPSDYVRYGLGLALLSLLDGSVAEQTIALQTCRELAAVDVVLRAKVRERLLVAVQSGEVAQMCRGSDELAAFVIATLGEWRVAEALPFLEEMARAGHAGAPSSRSAAALTQALEELWQRSG